MATKFRLFSTIYLNPWRIVPNKPKVSSTYADELSYSHANPIHTLRPTRNQSLRPDFHAARFDRIRRLSTLGFASISGDRRARLDAERSAAGSFVPNYRLQVQRRDLDVLQMHAKDQVYVLSVLSKNGNNWTTNLKSPVILNSTRRLAVQVVVIDEQPLTQPIILTDALELQKVA
jgi:hypothetical protein